MITNAATAMHSKPNPAPNEPQRPFPSGSSASSKTGLSIPLAITLTTNPSGI
jgi:hypothetical protein